MAPWTQGESERAGAEQEATHGAAAARFEQARVHFVAALGAAQERSAREARQEAEAARAAALEGGVGETPPFERGERARAEGDAGLSEGSYEAARDAFANARDAYRSALEQGPPEPELP